MEIILLAGRLAIALAFGVAGLAKLADRTGTRQAVINFGVPAGLALPVATLLPATELTLALALIPEITAWYAALAAVALLLIFMAAMIWNLALGRRPSCNCFGPMSAKPIGWKSLVRNAILATPAILIVAHGRANTGVSAVHWLTTLSTAEVVGLALAILGYALLALLTLLAFNLMRQQGRLLNRIDHIEAALASHVPVQPPLASPATPLQPVYGLPVGIQAPLFALSGLFGEMMTLDALLARQKPVLLLFSDPGCGPCSTLMPNIGHWQREHAALLTTAVISRGTVEANRAKSTEYGVSLVLLQKDDEVAQAYHSTGTPSGVVVLPNGTIGSPVTPGVDAVRELVHTTLAGSGTFAIPAMQPLPAASSRTPLPVLPLHSANGVNGAMATPHAPLALQVGDPAPALTLPDLDGARLSLADFLGQPLVLLFWNLGCGFCQQMLPDLRNWESNKPEGAPRMLIISTGAVDANRAMGLQAPIVLDQGLEVGATFGARGTPMAVLIDESGNVASSVAAGAPQVFALLESAIV
jgi:peroxiredoxin/uncharacterized membrane protein YphA (DoxX/SURF4 family)